jgi:hypothetical protein
MATDSPILISNQALKFVNIALVVGYLVYHQVTVTFVVHVDCIMIGWLSVR